jgi:hypothetical protein
MGRARPAGRGNSVPPVRAAPAGARGRWPWPAFWRAVSPGLAGALGRAAGRRHPRRMVGRPSHPARGHRPRGQAGPRHRLGTDQRLVGQPRARVPLGAARAARVAADPRGRPGQLERRGDPPGAGPGDAGRHRPLAQSRVAACGGHGHERNDLPSPPPSAPVAHRVRPRAVEPRERRTGPGHAPFHRPRALLRLYRLHARPRAPRAHVRPPRRARPCAQPVALHRPPATVVPRPRARVGARDIGLDAGRAPLRAHPGVARGAGRRLRAPRGGGERSAQRAPRPGWRKRSARCP